jgi:hypothetical protein
MLNKLLLVLFFVFSCVGNVIAQEYIYYSPKTIFSSPELIDDYIKQNISNPELVAVIFSANFTETLEDALYGEILLNSQMQFNEDDTTKLIGSANVWLHIFRNKDNVDDLRIVSVSFLLSSGSVYVHYFNIEEAIPSICKFSLNTPIDIDKILESDVGSDTFVKQLTENADYMVKLSDTQSIKNHIVGLYSVDESQYGMEANKIYWVSIIETLDSIYVCFTDYDNKTNLICNSYVGISEDNISPKINIYPNPTSKLINFDVPIDQVLNNLELFAINGNLLCKFNTDVTTLDLSAYNTGEYYLCFTLNNTNYYRSIILSK